MSSSLEIVCPHCSKKYRISNESIGKTVRCRSCQHAFKLEPTSASPFVAKTPPSTETAAAPRPTLLVTNVRRTTTLAVLVGVIVLAVSFDIWWLTMPSRTNDGITQSSVVASSANGQNKIDDTPERKLEMSPEQRSEQSARVLEAIQNAYSERVEVFTAGMTLLNWDSTKEPNAIRREETEKTLKTRRPEIEASMKAAEATLDEFFRTFDTPFTDWNLYVSKVDSVDGVARIDTIAKSISGNNLTFVFTDDENNHRAKIAELDLLFFARFSGKPTGRFMKESMNYTVFFTLDDVKQASFTRELDKLRKANEEAAEFIKTFKEKERKDNMEKNK